MTWDEILNETEKLQKEMLELNSQLDNKKALYKAFTKQHFGLVDGEPTNVLDIARAIKLVQSK